MPRKTEKEIKEWVENKKTKKGDKLVIADEDGASASIPHIKKEVEKL